MKNNILLNPFAIIADKRQTIIGVLAFFIGTILSYLLQINVQVLRINPLSHFTFLEVVINQLILISILTFALFGIGKIINKKTRFIDLFNGTTIAFIPLYISLLQNINNYLTNETNTILESLKTDTIYNLQTPILFIVISLIGFFLFIYYIYLLFIGFKTATNSKKAWHYLLFFFTVIVIDLFISTIQNSI